MTGLILFGLTALFASGAALGWRAHEWWQVRFGANSEAVQLRALRSSLALTREAWEAERRMWLGTDQATQQR